jgi:hypothetical protein
MAAKFSSTTKLCELRFRALLTEDDDRVRFYREASNQLGGSLA